MTCNMQSLLATDHSFDKLCNSNHIDSAEMNGSGTKTNNAYVPIIDVHKGRPIRLQVKVLVPIEDHPNFNFIGKLLGPKGNSLKWLQEQTQTKIAILGKGSMRDRQKEEELRLLDDPKYYHLNEDLHVEITAFAPPPEAYTRIGHALHEVKRFLVPDYYDDIRQQQLRELGILSVDKKQMKNRTAEDTLRSVDIGDFDQFSSQKTSSNASRLPPANFVRPNGLTENHYSCVYVHEENDVARPFNSWEQKSSFKSATRLTKSKPCREKPYERAVTGNFANF